MMKQPEDEKRATLHQGSSHQELITQTPADADIWR